MRAVVYQGTTVHPCIPYFCVDSQASVQPPTYGGMAAADQAFTSVTLGDRNQAKKNKAPRRILHFSDGVLEEYSTDEDEDENDSSPLQPVVDPVSQGFLWWWLFNFCC